MTYTDRSLKAKVSVPEFLTSHLTKFSCLHYATGKKDSMLNLMGRLLEILCAFTT